MTSPTSPACCTATAVLDEEASPEWQANITALRVHDADRTHRHWHEARGHLAAAIRVVAGRMWTASSDVRIGNLVEEAIDGRGHYEDARSANGEEASVWKRDRKGLVESWSESAGPVESPVRVVRVALHNLRIRPRLGDRPQDREDWQDEKGNPNPHIEALVYRAVAALTPAAEPDQLPREVADSLEAAARYAMAIVHLRIVHPLPANALALVIEEALADYGANETERRRVRDDVTVSSLLREWADLWARMADWTKRDIELGPDRLRWQHVQTAPFLERTDSMIRAWQARYHAWEGHAEWTAVDEVPQGKGRLSSSRATGPSGSANGFPSLQNTSQPIIRPSVRPGARAGAGSARCRMPLRLSATTDRIHEAMGTAHDRRQTRGPWRTLGIRQGAAPDENTNQRSTN
ncbi:MAG: hypothetical protein ACOYOB_19670 [Myxococcota bacterium]